MKSRFLICTLLSMTLLSCAGCLHVVREARKEKADAAFAKLAALPPERVAGFMTDSMTEKLALTPAQQPAVAAINLKYARQMQITAASPDNVRDKARALKQQEAAKQEELKTVLIPDQLTHYLEMRDEMREKLKSLAASQAQ
jgi:hypothetical protein